MLLGVVILYTNLSEISLWVSTVIFCGILPRIFPVKELQSFVLHTLLIIIEGDVSTGISLGDSVDFALGLFNGTSFSFTETVKF